MAAARELTTYSNSARHTRLSAVDGQQQATMPHRRRNEAAHGDDIFLEDAACPDLPAVPVFQARVQLGPDAVIRRWRRFDQDAEPAEVIDAFMVAAQRRRTAGTGDAVKAVAVGDKIGVDAQLRPGG
jgi:hypothetical protein